MNASVNDFLQFEIKSGGPSPKILIEADSQGQPLYIGKAPRGTATSAAKWQIVKWTISGTLTTIETSLKNQIWDDRVSVTYA